MVDIKKLKPLGVVLILAFTVFVIILCFTADMGVPEPYESLHDTQYYMQSEDTLQELVFELEENVLPNLEGSVTFTVLPEDKKVLVTTGEDNYDKVRLVLMRDFSEELFEFTKE